MDFDLLGLFAAEQDNGVSLPQLRNGASGMRRAGEKPSSEFLVQPDGEVQPVSASSLPCFTTDYGRFQAYSNRVNIPLADAEAHVTFYLARK